jgi:hypothetical protein
MFFPNFFLALVQFVPVSRIVIRTQVSFGVRRLDAALDVWIQTSKAVSSHRTPKE